MREPAANALDWEPIQALPARGDNVSLGRCRRSGRLLCLTRCTAEAAARIRPAVGRNLEGVADVTKVEAEAEQGFVLSAWTAGMTLEEEILLSGPLPAVRARHIVRSIARSLGSLHACGAVHGFVSPASIVMTGDGPVLTHAARTDDARRHSPERVRDGSVSVADDVWALHMVLLEALTGVPLFVQATSPNEVQRAVEGAFPDKTIHNVSDPLLRTVLVEGLAPDPNRRGTASSLKETLERPIKEVAITKAVPTGAYCPRVPVPKRRVIGRWPSLLIAGGVVCAALLVVAASRYRTASGAASTQFAATPIANATASPASSFATPSVATPPATSQFSNATASSASSFATPSVATPPATSQPTAPLDIESCFRSHFPPGAFDLERSLAPVCHATDGRDLARFVTSRLVLSSEGRLTESMDEWSRLQGFQPVVLVLLRRRCCSSTTPWNNRAPAVARFWEAADTTAAALDEGQADVATIVRYRKAAARTGEHWWYAAPPCTGGQRWLDRFLARNGRPARTGDLCKASIGH